MVAALFYFGVLSPQNFMPFKDTNRSCESICGTGNCSNHVMTNTTDMLVFECMNGNIYAFNNTVSYTVADRNKENCLIGTRK